MHFSTSIPVRLVRNSGIFGAHASAGGSLMATYRCSKCGHEAEVAPKWGTEIVSVYCCRHTTQVRGQTDPIHMELVPALVPARAPELVPVT